jgi:uncharacterized membrane protein YhaH (DUF805 family)
LLTCLKILSHLTTPKGRLSRRWYWVGMIAVLGIVFFLMPLVQATVGRWASVVLFLPFYWSIFSLMSQRVHDVGRSAGWLAVLVIPVVGLLWCFVVLGFRRGDPGENQYGDDPRPPTPDYLVVKITS